MTNNTLLARIWLWHVIKSSPFIALLSAIFFCFVGTNALAEDAHSNPSKTITLSFPEEKIYRFTADHDHHRVIFITEHTISIFAELKYENKKQISVFGDLYRRHRLFLPAGDCELLCTLAIKSTGIEGTQGNVSILVESFPATDNDRYQIEHNLYQANQIEEGDLEGSFYEAYPFFKQAASQWGKYQNTREMMDAHFHAADAGEFIEKYDFGLSHSYELLRLGLSETNHIAVMSAYLQLGRNHNTQTENPQKAFEFLERGITYAKANRKDITDEQWALYVGEYENLIGNFFLYQGQLEAAREHFNEALKHFGKINYNYGIAQTYDGLGYIWRLRNKLDIALAYHQMALQRFDTSPYILTFTTLYYIGVISALNGHYYHSLSLLDKAEKEVKLTIHPEWEGHIVAAKAKVKMFLGEYNESKSLYDRAIALYTHSSSPEIATVNLNLGHLHEKIGDYSTSLAFLEKADYEFSEATNIQHRVKTYLARANNYLISDQPNQALNLLDQLEEDILAAENDYLYGQREFSYAKIYHYLNDSAKALAHLDNAIKIQEQNDNKLELSESLLAAAEIRAQLEPQNETIALSLVNKAIRLTEAVREQLVTDDLKQQFFSLQRKLYHFKVRFLIDSKNSDENLISALLAAEQFKAKSLHEKMVRNQDNSSFMVTEKSEYLFDEALFIEETLSNFRSRPALPELSLPFTYENFTHYRTGLNKGEVVLYYYELGERTVAWKITPENVFFYNIVSTSILDNLIKDYLPFVNQLPRSRLSRKQRNTQIALQKKLSNTLLHQVDLGTDVEQITIIPSGQLHRLPFATLLSTDGNRLISNRTLSYANSLATEYLLASKDNDQKYVSNALLIVSNPDFNPQRNSQTENHFPRDIQLNPLPYSELEAKAIIDVWPNTKKIHHLQGATATKDILLGNPIDQFEVMHFASHAIIDWDNPDLSAIALASTTHSQVTFDTLTAGEISEWNIGSELIVLSGCETGIGKSLAGEGPLALSRAFFEAGAQRVIASQWPVEDEASAYLFERFYDRLINQQTPPVQALQLASMDVREQPQWSHPYFWSGFIYIGNKEDWRGKTN